MTITAHTNKTERPARPKLGRVIQPRKDDSVRDYPTAGLTPSGLAAVLREADDGSLSTAMQLFEEMEEKDAHLFSVANTRRLALTGLEWEILSAADLRAGVDRALADEAADYCRDVIAGIDSFEEILQHLSLAVGRNLAVAEIVWDVAGGSLRPVDLLPVAFTRLTFDEFSKLRILTARGDFPGTEQVRRAYAAQRLRFSTAGWFAARLGDGLPREKSRAERLDDLQRGVWHAGAYRAIRSVGDGRGKARTVDHVGITRQQRGRCV